MNTIGIFGITSCGKSRFLKNGGLMFLDQHKVCCEDQYQVINTVTFESFKKGHDSFKSLNIEKVTCIIDCNLKRWFGNPDSVYSVLNEIDDCVICVIEPNVLKERMLQREWSDGGKHYSGKKEWEYIANKDIRGMYEEILSTAKHREKNILIIDLTNDPQIIRNIQPKYYEINI